MTDAETWRPIPSQPRYEASSLGRIRNPRTGRVLKLRAQRNGYMKVNLGRSGRDLLVNRLVCEAFHGPPPTPGAHADHRDFVRTNNAADNLRWLSAAVNIGRQLRRIEGGWVCEADLEPPEDHVPMTDAERVALDELAEAAGW